MALQQNLTAPFVVEPLRGHTHTVIFLHRFPAATDDKSLRTKVLSGKRVKDGSTLRLQFPAVRWVFPHAKIHARPDDGTPTTAATNNSNSGHWENLTAEDCANAGLDLGTATNSAPYITQLILQEAKRVGGLNHVILGGQGETAIAAHNALDWIQETMSTYEPHLQSEMHAFVQQEMSNHLSALQPWKLAGYVSMHPDNQQATRDQRDYWLVSRFTGSNDQQPISNSKVNSTIMRNTPHEFIRGGYKEVSSTWDGQRIDEFAEFMDRVGVARGEPNNTSSVPSPTIISTQTRAAAGPIEGRSNKPADPNKEGISEQKKYADEVKRQKQRNEEHRQRILRQIEDQKVERRLRQERERVSRFHVEQAALEKKAAEVMASQEAVVATDSAPIRPHRFEDQKGYGMVAYENRDGFDDDNNNDDVDDEVRVL